MKYLATKNDLQKLEKKLFKPEEKGSIRFYAASFFGHYVEPSLEEKINEVNKRIDALCSYLKVDIWNEKSDKYVARKHKKNG